MTWYQLAVFGLAYFIAAVTPGPGVAAVVAQGLSRGARGAPAFIAGFMVGDWCWFFAAVLGLSALAKTAHLAFLAVKYAGVLYLLYLGYRLLSAPAQNMEPESPDVARRPRALFMGSLALTLGNPKPMIFFLALLPSVVPVGELSWRGDLAIAAVIGIIQPLVLGSYVLIASRARRFLRNPRAVRIVNRGSGTLMM